MKILSYDWKWKYAIVALILFISAAFMGNSTFDVAVHDTYFVVAKYQICIGFGIVFVLFSLIDFAMLYIKRPMTTWVVAIHWLISVVSIRVLFTLFDPESINRDYEDWSVYNEMDKSQEVFDVNFWIAALFVLFTLAQIGFFTGMLHSLFIKKPSK